MMRTEAEIRAKLARIEEDLFRLRPGGEKWSEWSEAKLEERMALANQRYAAIRVLKWALGEED